MALAETANNQSHPNSDQTTNKQTQQHSNDNQHQQQMTDIDRKGMTHSLIESCVGLFQKQQMHRNVMDFDGQYIKDSLKMKNIMEKMSSFPKIEGS